MKMPLDEGKLIYMQIADSIEDEVISGALNEKEQVYSTNQFAKLYGINPATAAKGINLLVEEGILFKKRGIGMFVAEGAKDRIVDKRKRIFVEEYITRLIHEARKLNITKEELLDIIRSYEGGDK
ncbi:GntR family transcriptional regulator [Lutispora saccharofermentans]|uniref:GntR family transcriptional regulator n=1 Tax=Lutispora saccharofermentans TaxID=3024236 RepID=A0ABT1NFV6_9FIRM|nr:GntR family transcriptional regulator [Lutispora saccharofermentans]MCQ1530160.1 GntR family transcriptional regulator [Lutispora saccharofermentans]